MLSPDDSSGLQSVPLIGFLGHNIGYSLSPMLHEAADHASNRMCDYQLFDVPPGNLEGFLSMVNEIPGLKGFNVTIPYKEVMARRLKEVAPSARESGAVNVVNLEAGELVGYNTDRPGFIYLVKAGLLLCRCPMADWNAVILGAGGAAKAAVWALLDLGMTKKFFVMGRDEKKLASFVNDFLVAGQHFGTEFQGLDWLDWTSVPAPRDDENLMLVNATPIGTMDLAGCTSLPVHLPHPEIMEYFNLVLDLVYSPGETGLMAAARASGVTAVGGAIMLIEQAIQSRRIWFGQADEDAERKAMGMAYDQWMQDLVDLSEGRS